MSRTSRWWVSLLPMLLMYVVAFVLNTFGYLFALVASVLNAGAGPADTAIGKLAEWTEKGEA